MDDTTHPPIMPPSETPPVYGPVREAPDMPVAVAPRMTPPSTFKKLALPPWAIIVGVIAILVLGVILFAGRSTPASPVESTPTPTATPSASFNRVLSAIATESAFIKFEADLEALSRGIQNTQIQNQQLIPPRLYLPLGFSN